MYVVVDSEKTEYVSKIQVASVIEKTSGTVQMWRYLRRNCRKTVGKIKDLKFIEISPSVTECYTTKGKILRKKSIFKDISLYFKLTCTVSFRIQSECGKIRTRKTPNTDTFHAVYSRSIPSKVFERVLNTSLILFNPFLVNVFRGCKMKTLS